MEDDLVLGARVLLQWLLRWPQHLVGPDYLLDYSEWVSPLLTCAMYLTSTSMQVVACVPRPYRMAIRQ